MDRDTQIKLIETVDERREAYTRVWMSDAEFTAVLHRYDHEFDEQPPARARKRA